MARDDDSVSVLQSHRIWITQFEPWLIPDALLQLCGELQEKTVLTIKLWQPSIKVALSTGRCPKWPIWQGERGQRAEDSQIIHKHNGHQYWKDDRWDCQQRQGFNFYSFFSCRRPYRFSQSHLSDIRPVRRSQAPREASQGRLFQWRRWQNVAQTFHLKP